MSATSSHFGKRVSRRFRLAALFLFCISLLGCGKGGEEEQEGTLLGILVSPQDVIVPIGSDVQLYATGLYDDRSSRDLTSIVSWKSSAEPVVNVSNDLDREGLAEGISAGQVEIEAEVQGLGSVPVRVTVTSAELQGITVEPSAVSLEEGQSLQLSAKAVYSDGSRGDASTQVRWLTSDGSVATLESSGLLKAVGEGTAEVHASMDGVSSQKVPVSIATSGSPDLYVKTLVLEPSEDGFTVSYQIGNKGDAASTGFFVDLFVNPSSSPGSGDVGEQYAIHEYVSAGSLVSGTFLVSAPYGDHEAVLVADLDNVVDEKNEGNNRASDDVTVGSSTTGPNLTISYFSYSATVDTIYYFVDITNTGGEGVGEFLVDLFYDKISPPKMTDDGDEWTLVESLAAGATTYADFEVPVSEMEDICSYCWSWVMVDGYEFIEETNESDNIEGSITVTY